jgi:putative flavoprotein involved in K+ transport
MALTTEVAIVGAGQAGLATSFFLSQAGLDHVVLEAGDVGESWRERWDTFRLVTPNWTVRLPGFEYGGGDPEGFMTGRETREHLMEYARRQRAPVRPGQRVTGLALSGRGYRLSTSTGMTVSCRQVVVATGPFQCARIPPQARTLAGDVQQLHSGQYRNPSRLRPGTALVVGSGQSGCQIAEELRRSGRTVYLSLGRCGWLPRRYRGRDICWWADVAGIEARTVDELPSPDARFECNPQLTGADGGRDLNIHTVESEGVILLGRMTEVSAERIAFESDVDGLAAQADELWSKFRPVFDSFAERARLDLPTDLGPSHPPRRRAPPTELTVGGSGVAVVVWATGYRRDFSWIHLPVFADDGEPRHKRGVTDVSGLYFVGLPWQHRADSAQLAGVGADAEYVAKEIVRRAASNRSHAAGP